jgi:uncharacterized protein (TIGR00255 family)
MIKSMTAFGKAKKEGADRDYTVEIKAVNSRYFDCNVKLPRAYLFLEEKIKSFIQKNVTSRGKLDVYLTVQNHTEGEASIELDEGYVKGYLAALYRLRDEYGLPDDISVMTVARSADVFVVERKEEDLSAEWARVEEVLAAAAEGFTAMRENEGARMESDLRQKVSNIQEIVERIGKESVRDIGAYREKLETRLRTILDDHAVNIDENRILTECAIMADRLAVDEELVRLHSHFVAFEEILASGEPAGRKLDFLMQEMNRETNTIGSKCSNAEIAKMVVAVKCELEKIREQIQNIE